MLDVEARLFDIEPYHEPAGGDIALTGPNGGECLAVMRVTEKYAIDKAHECAQVSGPPISSTPAGGW